MLQEILTYAVLAIVAIIVVGKAVRSLTGRQSGRKADCAGCPLADSCAHDTCHQPGHKGSCCR